MTVKVSGDTPEDLDEIYQALAAGVLGQERFTLLERYSGFLGFAENGTEGWISNDGEYVRIVLSSTSGIIDDLFNSNQLLDY